MKARMGPWSASCTPLGIALLLLLTTALLALGCEPGGEITIENRQAWVRIYVAHVRDDGTLSEAIDYGIAPGNGTRKLGLTFLGPRWLYRIEARDASGRVVFSHDYNMDDLEKISWRIVIPPAGAGAAAGGP